MCIFFVLKYTAELREHLVLHPFNILFLYTLLINVMTAGLREQEINVMQSWPGILKSLLNVN